MHTPVVFLTFNRPAVTERVVARIREAAPRHLYVVSDGPRESVASDAENVRCVRRLIERGVDWPCELTRDYADSNLGCARRVASGITAALQRYDRAIILEDDTLPDASFFAFCELMLSRFADDPRVTHVSGTNVLAGLGKEPSADGCVLSRFSDIWGWATWRRAWQKYDLGLTDWPAVRDSGWLESVARGKRLRKTLRGMFDQQVQLRDAPQTWDASWIYRCLHGGFSVTPKRNLVTNLGFGGAGTHTLDPADRLASLRSTPIDVGRIDLSDLAYDRSWDERLMARRLLGVRHKSLRRAWRRGWRFLNGGGHGPTDPEVAPSRPSERRAA